MNQAFRRSLFRNTVLLFLLLISIATVQAQNVDRPSWAVGDSWIVETKTLRIQGRSVDAAGKPLIVRWQFEVKASEKIAGEDCFRLEIRSTSKGRIRPKTTMWVDKKNGFTRQIDWQVVDAGQYRTITESFTPGADGQAPTMPTLTSLPLDLPVFLPSGSRSANSKYVVTNRPGAAGSRDVDTIAFATSVSQEVNTPKSGSRSLKAVESLPGSRSLQPKEYAEVKLGSSYRNVTQLWDIANKQPWPVYSDNGVTEARLISVKKDGG